jgi:hypothetical protein
MNSNGGSSFFGSDWLGAFLIIAILFGGGLGWGGNRGGYGPGPDVATKEYVMESVNNQSTQNGLRDILLSSANNNFETAKLIMDQNAAMQQQNFANQINVLQGFNALQQQIAQMGFQMENCCCSIKTQMLQDKYEALQELYRNDHNDLSNAAQSQYILNALGRFVAYPSQAATVATAG